MDVMYSGFIGKELSNIYSYTQISFLQVTPSFHRATTSIPLLELIATVLHNARVSMACFSSLPVAPLRSSPQRICSDTIFDRGRSQPCHVSRIDYKVHCNTPSYLK